MSHTLIQPVARATDTRPGTLYYTPTPAAYDPPHVPGLAWLYEMQGVSGSYDGTEATVVSGTPEAVATARGMRRVYTESAAIGPEDARAAIRAHIAGERPVMRYWIGVDVQHVDAVTEWLAAASEPAAFSARWTDGTTTYAVAPQLDRTLTDARNLGRNQRAMLGVLQSICGALPKYFFVQAVAPQTPAPIALEVRQPAGAGRRVLRSGELFQWSTDGVALGSPPSVPITAGDPVDETGVMDALGLSQA